MDTSKRIEQTLFCPVPFCSWFSKEVFEILNSTGVGMCGITVISIQASKLHMTSTHRAFLLLPQALEKRAQLTSRAWSHHFLGWDNLHFGGPSVGAEWEREGKFCLLLPICIGCWGHETLVFHNAFWFSVAFACVCTARCFIEFQRNTPPFPDYFPFWAQTFQSFSHHLFSTSIIY